MVQVSVSVDDEHLPQIEAVASALRAHGMRVAEVHDALGVITGEVDDERKDSLGTVAGVISVDAQQHFQLPPPDSPVQ